jgi:D-glycero-D-manno-heptose 1,7-bisphosphate phosphatase
LSGTSRRAVFLDRDGVLNRAIVTNGKPLPPQTLDEFEILPEVPNALARLRAAGFVLVCVTNQPDVARGTQRREIVEEMHKRLQSTLSLDDILACYEDGEGCPMRKPEPGMLKLAAAKHSISLARSYMVGDRWRDIEAGRSAGCRTVFLDRGYDEELRSPPDKTAHDLADAVSWILTTTRGQNA